MTRIQRLYLCLLLLLLLPRVAMANGVSPLLNFFHEDTWLPASIVTLVIILLESGFVRWRFRSLRFTGALWRCCIINLASSATGSILLLAVSRDSYFMWDTMSLVFPFFLITLATEIPLFRILFKALPLPWKAAFILGCGINFASYVMVFILQFGLLVGWLSYAGHLDKQELEQWDNPALLEQVSGRIYAIDSTGSQHRLRVCEPPNSQWTTLTNCPPLDPNTWDVERSTCAWIRLGTTNWKERSLMVGRLPDFQAMLELPPLMFADEQFDNSQGVTDVAISPDEKKVAILYRQTDAVAPKNGSSHFNLGSKCKLIVIDIASGQEIARAVRWASAMGLCWFPDSRRVLFSSFDDESLYQFSRAEVRGSTSYGVGYGRDAKFQRALYAFDIETGAISRITSGYDPFLAVGAGIILVRDQGDCLLLDSLGKVQERFDVARLASRGAVLSPSGTLILSKLRRHVPFYAGGRLVLFHTKSPNDRHILDDGSSYRIDWTVEVEAMPTQ